MKWQKPVCEEEAKRIRKTMDRIFKKQPSQKNTSDVCIHYHVCHQRVMAGCPSNGCPEFERR